MSLSSFVVTDRTKLCTVKWEEMTLLLIPRLCVQKEISRWNVVDFQTARCTA